MSGPEFPDTPPPEVPEEFADAYREAFNRALAEGQQPAGAHLAGVEAAGEAAGEAGETQTGGAHRGEPPADEARVTEYRSATPMERLRESAFFMPLVVALLALLLIGCAYAAGRLFSHRVEDSTQQDSGPRPTSSQEPSPAGGATPRPPVKKEKAQKPYRGDVQPVRVEAVTAPCTMPPGRNASGGAVTYDAANMIDRDRRTAWRCDGDASGRTIVLDLPSRTKVAEVGLLPGYAKTDRASGADRYAENNRVTRVRWTLADGVTVEQRLDGNPDHRRLQSVRVPLTSTGRIRLEILEVARGPRNTTAISELRVAAAR